MAGQLSLKKAEQAKDELDRTVRSLSTDFQLQLHIPDLTLSPSKRRQQHRNGDQERSEHIYLCAYRLKFQDPNRLAICLTRFREQADEHLKNWIRKPRADPDTTPSKSFGPPRSHARLASEERAELQDFLLQLLKDDNIASRQRSKHSKRKSDEFPDPSSKRSRNSFEGSPACESIDSIPVRSRAVASSSRLLTGRPARGAGTSSFTNGIATASFASTQPSSFGTRSFNSSKVSLAPTVFTNDYAPSTQATTVTNTSFKRSQLPFQATQPSLTSNATSSKDIQIPFSQSIRKFAYQPPSEENRNDIDPPKPPSFRRYEDRTPPEPVIDLTDDDEPEEEPRLPILSIPQPIKSQVDFKRAGMIRSSSPATAYSSLPEMNEFDTMLFDAPISDPELPECLLTDRLRNIWPKFPIPGLNQAPLIILWELTRAALHCRLA
ncbi:qde-1 RNA-dependent RNA polymerase (RdRP) [Fusarium fujikuroi]|nr:qde-1 RNA-dependent RNA polymerase (RdRP) [Fusarium fujikuroi]